MIDKTLRIGDVIEVHGVFRDGTMDESRSRVAENRQIWRVARDGGDELLPILASGEADVESYWFGRATGIAYERGRAGVMSRPTVSGRN